MPDLIQRDIIRAVNPWLAEKEIIVLLGARQVGKTSIMKMLQDLIKDGPILYLDLENSLNLTHTASVENFVAYLSSRGLLTGRRTYCFLDEIQYHADPTKFLKLLHDHQPNVKLIVSGSSSFAIRQKFKDALTGRKQVFTVSPLSFAEFLRFKNHALNSMKHGLGLDAVLESYSTASDYRALTSELLPLWEEFVVYGGYPLPSLTQNVEMKEARLREIYNSYVQKDIKDLARIDDVLQFNQTVIFLGVQISQLLKTDEVAKEVGLPSSRLHKYLFLLEITFIISRLRPFHTNRQKELTKMPKLFFRDTGLRNTGLSDFRPLSLRPDAGALVENQCLMQVTKNAKPGDSFFFWRTWDKNEVDFVRVRGRDNLLPIEVKYQTFHEPKVPASLRNFMKTYNCTTGVVVTKEYMDVLQNGSSKVYFIPAWMI